MSLVTFVPFIASATLKAVSLQLNGMLMMWKYSRQGKMTAFGPPEFILLSSWVTGLKCSYGHISTVH